MLAAIVGGQIVHAFYGSYALATSSVALVNIMGIIAALFIPKHENFLLEELPTDRAAGTGLEDSKERIPVLSR